MDSTNVIVGAGKLYVAPLGTTLPTLDGSTYPVVWPAAWIAVGYTADGVDINYAPTMKDIVVDEEMAPVKRPLVAEKATITAKLAEATLANLNRLISGSVLTQESITYDVRKLTVGSLTTDNQVMLGFEGPAPGTFGLTRVVICYKTKSIAQIAMKYQRQDKVVLAANFECLADSTRAAGDRLLSIVDLMTSFS